MPQTYFARLRWIEFDPVPVFAAAEVDDRDLVDAAPTADGQEEVRQEDGAVRQP